MARTDAREARTREAYSHIHPSDNHEWDALVVRLLRIYERKPTQSQTNFLLHRASEQPILDGPHQAL